MTKPQHWDGLADTFSNLVYLDHKHFQHIQIGDQDVIALLSHLASDPAFQMDYLKYITVVDWDEHFELAYHLYSYRTDQECLVSVLLPRENPMIESCHHIWPAADWHEREMYDLFGVTFTNHPNLQRLLLPPDWVGHPLRKDYQQGERYQGVSTTRNYLTKLPSAPK